MKSRDHDPGTITHRQVKLCLDFQKWWSVTSLNSLNKNCIFKKTDRPPEIRWVRSKTNYLVCVTHEKSEKANGNPTEAMILGEGGLE